MSDRDDAPPAEAVEVLTRVLRIHPGEARVMLLTLRRRMDSAAHWRLIGWLAQGLEPTEAMVEAVTTEQLKECDCWTPLNDILRAALAAAREASDGQ
jgi:hypothetical protein